MSATTTLSLSFTAPDGPDLVLEQDSAALNALQLRLYPAVQAIVFATHGTAELGETRLDRRQYELVRFNFDTRVKTRYPASGNLEINPLYPGLFFNREGEEIPPPAFHLDLETSELVAAAPFFGGASIAYDALYRVVNYTPSTYPKGEVLALYGDKQASLELTFNSPDDRSRVTLYEVTSKTIVDSVDVWEEPPDWPNDNTYPVSPYNGPSKKNFLEQQRVHEIGLIDRFGIWEWRTTAVYWERPYVNAIGYAPKYEFSKASPPAGLETVFLKAPWSAIRNRVQSLYPGITGI